MRRIWRWAQDLPAALVTWVATCAAIVALPLAIWGAILRGTVGIAAILAGALLQGIQVLLQGARAAKIEAADELTIKMYATSELAAPYCSRVDGWIERTATKARDYLMGQVPKPKTPSTGTSRSLAEALAMSFPTTAMGMGIAQSRQSVYTDAVDSYIQSLRETVPAYVRWRLVQLNLGRLELELENATDRTWHGLEVQLELPPGAEVILADVDRPKRLPAPPDWGTTKARSSLEMSFPTPIVLANRPPLTLASPFGTVVSKASESVTVRFPQIDLRPHETVKLPRLHLLFEWSAPAEAEVHLRATASDGRGVVENALVIAVDHEADLRSLVEGLLEAP